MTDRELLELAAKAYWGDEIGDTVDVEWSDEDEAIAFTHGENQDHNGRDCMLIWNPMIDDGDALRLAVKLEIWPMPSNRCGEARVSLGSQEEEIITVWHGEVNDDKYAATRRAIVRAAAEIGKAMP